MEKRNSLLGCNNDAAQISCSFIVYLFLGFSAFLLSRLCHENIIRVYGATAGGITDAFLEPGGYFLVLEALEGTLHDLLNKWRELDPPKTNTSVRSLFKANSLPVDGGSDDDITIPSVQHRLQKIAVGIARGVRYLVSLEVKQYCSCLTTGN